MKKDVKNFIQKIPGVRNVARWIYRSLSSLRTGRGQFSGSKDYWEQRYAAGGDSGAGSYGKLAEFKASVLDQFVTQHNIQSVIEFGCGDGNQLALLHYPAYLGMDVSETAVSKCQKRFAGDSSKRFCLVSEYAGEQADLAVSLDVIFHLVEDDVYDAYMRTLFEASSRYVIIYASNTDDNRECNAPHFKHRLFTHWVKQQMPDWKLIDHIPNQFPYQGDGQQGSVSDFFIFAKT